MNSITIAGPLGRDSELRSIPSGEQVLSFSVADSAGRDKPTIWWNCQLWGKRANSLGPYLTKGQQVTVSGVLSEREWTDKDGAKRKAMEVRVYDVALQGKPQSAEAPSKPQQRPSRGFEDDGSDIPF